MAADPRFFRTTGPHPIAAVAAAAGATVVGDDDRAFVGVASLGVARSDEVSFLDGKGRVSELRASAAGAVLLRPELADTVQVGRLALVVADPQLAFARVAALFHPPKAARPGHHPTAVIALDAVLGDGCEVGPYAVIGDGATLGTGCIIGPHAVIGAGVTLGVDCRLHAHSSIAYAIAGDRVTLHAGARVGGEGFGLVPLPDGRYLTTPQLGRVLLGDDVEIGTNSTVDRGSGRDTVLGAGTRLDNLVHVGHNVRTGRGCVLAGQVGVSGSTTLGDFVVAGGQAGIADHLTIGDRARVGAKAGLHSDVPAGIDVLGSPAWPAREFARAMARLRRLGASSNGKAG